jgi:3-deoxy-D-manno-octulosonate 8-phosphate phosphatase (KDO 8-P phosphatase)
MEEPMSDTLQQRCLGISLLVMDVDGVLTAGGIVHGGSGMELKAFHVRDGGGLAAWHRAGRRSAIVTGRQSTAVEVRAAELGIALVVQGAADKNAALDRLLAEVEIGVEAMCYIGDDLADLGPLRRCRLAAAVADACPEARAVAHYITQRPGGQGAVREVIELVLRCQGKWAH